MEGLSKFATLVSYGPHVSVLIVNYNSAQDTMQCIHALQQSTYSNFSVFLVDNASTDNSVLLLEEFIGAFPDHAMVAPDSLTESLLVPGKIVLVKSIHNGGFGFGNNLVLRHLSRWDAFVWLLNPDTLADKNAMAHLVKSAISGKRKVLGTKVFSFSEPSRLLHIGAAKINWNSGTIKPLAVEGLEIDYIYGGSLFTHSSVFREFGILPEHYFLYWEETDWCFSLKQNGVHLEVSAEAAVYDKVGGSIGRGYLAFFYYTRNSLLFIRKFRPEKVKYVLISNLLRSILRLISGQPKISRAILNGTYAYLKALK